MNNQGKIVTVNSRDYNIEINRTWKANLVEQTEMMVVLVGEFVEDFYHFNTRFDSARKRFLMNVISLTVGIIFSGFTKQIPPT